MILQQVESCARRAKYPLKSLLFFLLILPPCLLYAVEKTNPYLIGRGISDVTGPSYGIQMWGFGRADQLTEGLHIRQHSRAFVIAQAEDSSKRLVFVSADLGSIEHHITLAVIDQLQIRYGDLYTIKNVILSATHTHAGPGGYWHSRLNNGLDGGFYPEHFEVIVSGITKSIVEAHEDLQEGNIYLGKSQIANAGANRSMIAYLENPQKERDLYSENTPTEMTLLKFVDDSGEIGMLNWYALHPTAMNFYNSLISGDHKGYASLQMEQLHGNRSGNNNSFVAAFAQSDPGDVTPNTNLDNTGPGKTDFETTKIMGERQLNAALKIFERASEPLLGGVETSQVYVDLSNYRVDDRFTNAGEQATCPSAYGYAFAGGSTEDGGGHFLFREGMTEQNFVFDLLIRWLTGAPKWTKHVRDCQRPKPILFETGSGKPPLQSQIRSVTLALVGQLAILALPAEVTTMAGRRLRTAVMNELGGVATHIVLAGYSNGYAGYVTTPEEYLVQHYEGGHTLHGRWTLPAYQQIASRLASSLNTGKVVVSNTAYDDWRGKSTEASLYVAKSTALPKGAYYGDIFFKKREERTAYSKGETVKAEFWSHNPSDNYRTGNNYLQVEYKTKEGWKTIATDGDWNTTVRWRAEGDSMVATLRWLTPKNIDAGEYRLMHLGYDPQGIEFQGISRLINIK
jgi:neutral ceramidase